MNNIEQIKKRIQEKELQLKKLDMHKSSSEICEQLYNTLILEKAILKQELANMQKNHVISALKRFFTKREKMICDYFKG